MVALELVFWVLSLVTLAWVNSHPYFDKSGNEEGIDYDTILTILVGISVVIYFFVLIIRG